MMIFSYPCLKKISVENVTSEVGFGSDHTVGRNNVQANSIKSRQKQEVHKFG